jgi:hypothetical protein
MKSAYFNGARAGKPAIALIINGDITLDTDTIVRMVDGKPLYIRWNSKNPVKSVEVHYAKIALTFSTPHAVIGILNLPPMEELASVLATLGNETPTSTPTPKPRKSHITNPVKKAIASGTDSEFFDPELEKFLALLVECI